MVIVTSRVEEDEEDDDGDDAVSDSIVLSD
jgi:hypothetical protein